MCWTSFLIRLPFAAALAGLFIFAGNASALTWKSSDYNCQVQLPDGEPLTGGKAWSPVGSTEEGTLVGAMRVDGSAYVFLGYVNIAKRPKFHLNDKTIDELEKRFFGPGMGFSAVDRTRFIERYARLSIERGLNLSRHPLWFGGGHVRSGRPDLSDRRDERVRSTPSEGSGNQWLHGKFQTAEVGITVLINRPRTRPRPRSPKNWALWLVLDFG